MEGYSKNGINENTSNNSRGGGASSFLYGIGNGGSSSSHQFPLVMNGFHLPNDESNRFHHHHHHHPMVKMEGGSNNSLHQRFHYPSINDHHNSNEAAAAEAIKAKIIAHPQYSSLLQAYLDCQKVGAPAEVMARLATIRQEFEARQQASLSCGETSKDPELDQFMEAYYDMLVKYREELTRPLQEAMEFMQRIETQLNMLTTGPRQIFNSGFCSPG